VHEVVADQLRVTYRKLVEHCHATMVRGG
jgi:hypothetical protein